MALQRVAQRVRKGGHDIPGETVKRRFDSGLKNFIQIYRALADDWVIWDASATPAKKMAHTYRGHLYIDNESLYNEVITANK